ncbi:MAG TPA: ABC transporter substrate-binding protein [Chloroflexota bacterium]|nr:ABC transporter substrate-binding protein [Chloroflexota bacterium]
MNASARWLRGVLVLVVAAGMAALGAAPGPAAQAAPAGHPAPGPAAQLTHVQFGSPQAISDAGVFIGQAWGYFQAQGLDVETVPFQSGPNLIAPLASGDLEVGGGSFSTGLLNAADRGLAIKMVADKGTSRPGFEFSQILPRRDLVDSGQVRSLADLRGKRIAVASTRSGAEAIAHQVLLQAGVGIDEVNLVELGYPDQLVAFANGGIDAAVIIEPSLTAAVARGLAAPWDLGYSSVAYGGAYQAAALLYSGRFAGQTDLARRFMVAYLQGVRAYNDAFVKGERRDEVVRLLTESTSVKDPALYDQMQMAGLDPDGRLTRQSLQIEYDYFKDRGYYTGSATLDSVIDTSFAEAAAQALGPYR